MVLMLRALVVQLQDIANVKQEHFICFSLRGNAQIIRRRTVFIGTVDSVYAHPREIFAGPIADGATAVVVAHNHPTGNPHPGDMDIETTQRLISAGQILGIKVLDHIIVTGNKHFSFRDEGYMPLEIFNKEEGFHERIKD